MTRVYIPNVGEEERIGSSFNHLFHVIRKTETANEDVLWDFANVRFLHPCFLAPLSIYKATSKLSIACSGMSCDLQKYFDSVHFETPLHFNKDNDNDIKERLSVYITKTYTP